MTPGSIQDRASNAHACIQQGCALVRHGLTDEAASLFRQALQWQPDCADAHFCLGMLFHQQGRYGEADECYQRALTIDPHRCDVLNNLAGLGNVWTAHGEPDRAIACYQSVLRFRPNYAEVHYNLGLTLVQQGRIEEAVACYRQAIALKSDYVEAMTNLGLALARQGRFDEAVACQHHAIKLKPDYAQAYHSLGSHLFELGRFDDAVACYRQVIKIDPDFPDTHRYLASFLLLQGDLQHGWQEYEWREKRASPLPQPSWDGSPQPNRTILLYCEQGLGDTIQFLRYAPLVRQCCGQVVVECQSQLLSLAASCQGVDRVIVRDSPLPMFDLHCALMSLPAVFKTTLSNIPTNIPYLAADPDRIEYWRRELAAEPRFKVGIVWQGNPKFERDVHRSIRLGEFAPLAEVPGVALLSLQFGEGSEQLATAGLPITDLGSRAGPLENLAAILVNLDLLITVDTAPAHLAGALGLPFWLALSNRPHWPWLLDRSDSPWYPTARLFRQQEAGNWSTVFAEMAQALWQMQKDA